MDNRICRYTTVFWDWNGTLFDDVSSSLEAVNIMLKKRGLDAISLVTFRSAVDTPIIKFYREFFDMEKEEFSALSAEYHSLYEQLALSIPLAEGTQTVLETLKKQGVRQVIASSSHTQQIEKLIKRFGIRNYFDGILGADDYFASDKISRIREYMEKNSLCPEKTVFVGDTPHDAQVADSVGSQCVMALWGSKNPHELEGLGDTAENMAQVLEKMFE